jgi:hypothetical protein
MPVIILAMHGAPPIDFPTNETVEMFNLHARLDHFAEGESLSLRERYDQMDAKMRAWLLKSHIAKIDRCRLTR